MVLQDLILHILQSPLPAACPRGMPFRSEISQASILWLNGKKVIFFTLLEDRACISDINSAIVDIGRRVKNGASCFASCLVFHGPD